MLPLCFLECNTYFGKQKNMRSDSAHIILDRVRSTLNLLKKSNMLYSTPSSAPAVLPTVQVATSNHEVIVLKI